MGRIAFADESGTTGNTKCYAIGAFSLDEVHINSFRQTFEKRRQSTRPASKSPTYSPAPCKLHIVATLEPTTSINRGKQLAIARLAEMIRWDDLCYDTRPGSKLNIWHFPIEYRANPRTRRVRRQPGPIPFVTAEDLKPR